MHMFQNSSMTCISKVHKNQTYKVISIHGTISFASKSLKIKQFFH